MDKWRCARRAAWCRIHFEKCARIGLTNMKTINLKIPEIGLLAMTRAALGAGVALLISSKLDERERRAAGIALVVVGIVTTIPFALQFFGDDK
jgi:putative effector of murein hydrolase